MDKPSWGLLALSLAMLAGGAAAQEQPQARIWRVCVTDSSVPPFLHNDPARPGLIERLASDGGRKVGLNTLLLRYPIRRCQAMLAAEAVDAVVAAPTVANQVILRFPMKSGVVDASKRVARLHLVWVKRPDSPYAWDGQSMKGAARESLLVGTRSGMSAVIEPLLAKGFRVDATATSAQQVLMKLEAKRFDLAVALQEEVEFAMRDPRLQSLEVLSHALSTQDFYIGARTKLSADLQAQVEAWWVAMAQLRELPEYQVR